MSVNYKRTHGKKGAWQQKGLRQGKWPGKGTGPPTVATLARSG